MLTIVLPISRRRVLLTMSKLGLVELGLRLIPNTEGDGRDPWDALITSIRGTITSPA